jgi:hypothetical protein
MLDQVVSSKLHWSKLRPTQIWGALATAASTPRNVQPPPTLSVLSELALSTHSHCTLTSYAERSVEHVAGAATTPTQLSNERPGPVANGHKPQSPGALQRPSMGGHMYSGSEDPSSPVQRHTEQTTIPNPPADVLTRRRPAWHQEMWQVHVAKPPPLSLEVRHVRIYALCQNRGRLIRHPRRHRHHLQDATLALAGPRLESVGPAPASAQRQCPPAAGRRCTSSRRSPPRRRRLS